MKSIQEIREAHCDLLGSLDLSPFYSHQLSTLGDAIDELAHLREANAELERALGQLRLEVTHYRETGKGMAHLIAAEGEAIRVLLEHHSRAALSKAGSK